LIGTILTVLYVCACIFLILFVLLQPGKSDAGAIFSGGSSSTAFGPRGTQTVLAKITIGSAIAFFLIAFLFSIPGLFEKKSLGAGVKGQQAPIETPEPFPQATPAPVEEKKPTSPGTGAEGKPNATTPAKPEGAKPTPAQQPKGGNTSR
jgi:preprotein translocase subunit SecG